MDATTSRIANYAATLTYADLPPKVVHECKRRIVDTVGCALGAFDELPSRIARALAERASVPHGARVLGAHTREVRPAKKRSVAHPLMRIPNRPATRPGPTIPK